MFRILLLENSPSLFESWTDFGAGQGCGQGVVADAVGLLGVVDGDVAWNGLEMFVKKEC